MNPKSDFSKNGVAQAAILSVVIGVLILALVNLGTEISDPFKNAVHNIGKLWMPGAEGIGPYSGKETLALLAWFVNWAILHRILRRKEWNNQMVIAVFLVGLAIATTLIWPPVFTGIAHAVKGH